jgi:hypothetical protein
MEGNRRSQLTLVGSIFAAVFLLVCVGLLVSHKPTIPAPKLANQQTPMANRSSSTRESKPRRPQFPFEGKRAQHLKQRCSFHSALTTQSTQASSKTVTKLMCSLVACLKIHKQHEHPAFLRRFSRRWLSSVWRRNASQSCPYNRK